MHGRADNHQTSFRQASTRSFQRESLKESTVIRRARDEEGGSGIRAQESFDRERVTVAVGKHRLRRWIPASHRALIPHANFWEKGARSSSFWRGACRPRPHQNHTGCLHCFQLYCFSNKSLPDSFDYPIPLKLHCALPAPSLCMYFGPLNTYLHQCLSTKLEPISLAKYCNLKPARNRVKSFVTDNWFWLISAIRESILRVGVNIWNDQI